MELLHIFLIGGGAIIAAVSVGLLVDKMLDSKQKPVESKLQPEPEPVRARNDKGHFIPDDPATPDVNEAWVGGKAPETKPKAKTKPKKKKTTRKKKSVRKGSTGKSTKSELQKK